MGLVVYFQKKRGIKLENKILRTLNFMALRMIGHIGQDPLVINYYFLRVQ